MSALFSHKPHLSFKLPFREINTDNLVIALNSSRAKEELYRLSPLSCIRRKPHSCRKSTEFTNISAWTESEIPYLSLNAPHKNNNSNSSLHRRRSPPDKIPSRGKKSASSCWTESEGNTSKLLERRGVAINKVCMGSQDGSLKQVLSNLRANCVSGSGARRFRPFKSNIVLSIMKKRKYTTFYKDEKRPKAKKNTEELQAAEIFQQQDSNCKLVGLIQDINRLRSREKSDLGLGLTHQLLL